VTVQTPDGPLTVTVTDQRCSDGSIVVRVSTPAHEILGRSVEVYVRVTNDGEPTGRVMVPSVGETHAADELADGFTYLRRAVVDAAREDVGFCRFWS
jgi:hypothetical protein